MGKAFFPEILVSAGLPTLVGLILIWIGTTEGISGLKDYEETFLKIMEVLDLTERGLQNKEVLEHSSNKLMQASRAHMSFRLKIG